MAPCSTRWAIAASSRPRSSLQHLDRVLADHRRRSAQRRTHPRGRQGRTLEQQRAAARLVDRHGVAAPDEVQVLGLQAGVQGTARGHPGALQRRLEVGPVGGFQPGATAPRRSRRDRPAGRPRSPTPGGRASAGATVSSADHASSSGAHTASHVSAPTASSAQRYSPHGAWSGDVFPVGWAAPGCRLSASRRSPIIVATASNWATSTRQPTPVRLRASRPAIAPSATSRPAEMVGVDRHHPTGRVGAVGPQPGEPADRRGRSGRSPSAAPTAHGRRTAGCRRRPGAG